MKKVQLCFCAGFEFVEYKLSDEKSVGMREKRDKTQKSLEIQF